MRTIKQVAEKLQIPVSAIRYYEKNQLLKVQRASNNYRQYTSADEAQIKLILVMKLAGFSIKEIRELISLNNDDVLEPDCINRTNEIIAKKRAAMLQKIESQKKIVKLLDQMKPLAVARITPENTQKLASEIDVIFNEMLKEN